MINKLTTGFLCLALTVSASPMPAAADTLRPLAAENRDTRVGLEEQLTGRPVSRRMFLRAAAAAVFGIPALPGLVASAQTAQLRKATVTPSDLTLEFPPSLAGRSVGAYLFTDTGYLQGSAKPIPTNGVATFTVTAVSPPAQPGWVAAKDRAVAVFPGGVPAPATSSNPRIPGATLVVRIAPDGTLTVLVGQWPLTPSFRPGMGALAPLRQFLGPQRQIGVIVEGDPAKILALIRAGTDFFGTLVQAGHDTVWISGSNFIRISPGARQELVIAAVNAGLTTLGFIDGDFSWADPAVWPEVAALYQAQFDALLALDLGSMTVQWKTDIEQQDPARLAAGWSPWDGDMTGVMDLTEQIIVPGVQQFGQDYRARHPMVTHPVVRQPAVLQFGAPWLTNGSRPDPRPSIVPGAVVHGIRPLSRTGLSGATFQDTIEGIDAAGRQIRGRASQENAPFLYVVETAQQTDGRTFYGRVADVAPILLGAVERIPLDQFPLSGGVGWHAKDATEALSGAQQLLAAQILAAGPDGRSWVRRANSLDRSRFQIWFDATQTGELVLPAAFADARLLPQFNGPDYLFLKAETQSGDAFAVFGVRRPNPSSGVTTPTWMSLFLRDPQGVRSILLDHDPSDPSRRPIAMRQILPQFGPPNNGLAIRYSLVEDPEGALRTVVFVIEVPAGLEESAGQFLGERRLEERAVGELA